MNNIDELKKEKQLLEERYKLSLQYNNLIKNEDYIAVFINGLFNNRLKELVEELGNINITSNRYDNVVKCLNGISTLQNYLNSITITSEEYFSQLKSIDDLIYGSINNKETHND